MAAGRKQWQDLGQEEEEDVSVSLPEALIGQGAEETTNDVTCTDKNVWCVCRGDI